LDGDVEYEYIEVEEDAEGDDSDDDGSEESSNEDASEESEPEEPEEPEEEPEVDLGPDHPDAIGALEDIGARLILNQFGRVTRILFYDRHRDDDLDQIRNLPSLKEVWLLHTPRIKRAAVEALKERLEGVEIHYS
ncbi:MAG: hypothetical protein MKZ94_09960, partial [Pirellulales bacterium]|nr:hypothetical protein [Pirellulales bacterium]